MSILQQLTSFFQRPFPPTEDWRHRLQIAIIVSLFVTFFLYVFEPFGLSNLPRYKFWVCLGFGATTLVASLLFELFIDKVLGLYAHSQKYTFSKWILQACGLLVTISIANFLFGRWLQGSMDWKYFPQMIYATFSVGIFPIFILGYIAMTRQEMKYRTIASAINSETHHNDRSVQIDQSKGKTLFEDISVASIRYVESYQNYIKVGAVDHEGHLTESMHRATLKSIQLELEDTAVIKCHRSFLVNRNSVESVSGNAQGLVLSLQNCDKEIPVSRSYVALFRN